MIERVLALIVDEGKWLTASMGLALLYTSITLYRHRNSDLSQRQRVIAAMNLMFGITIGTMAFGHLLAVTVKLLLGTLVGSSPAFYLIGVALAVPSWGLVLHTRSLLQFDNDHRAKTITLNIWLAMTLLVLGIHNVPLAAPAFFNIAYQLHSRRAVGWTILGMALVVHLGLFIGSLIFLASGQSFEQFSGLE